MEQQKEVPSSPKSADLCVGHPRVCRMDCQNGSVSRNKQGEAGRPCGKEQKRSIWKTDVFKAHKQSNSQTIHRLETMSRILFRFPCFLVVFHCLRDYSQEEGDIIVADCLCRGMFSA